MGLVGIALLAAAMVFAFLRARYVQMAHREWTTDAEATGGRGGATSAAPRVALARREGLTEHGQALLRRARLFRVLFYLFGAGAVLAVWLRL